MSIKCYNTIDELPIRVWFDIIKTLDYYKLCINSVKRSDKTINILFDKWESLFNDWIKRFGFSDEYLSELKTSIRIAELQADYVITGKTYFRTLIRIEKEKIIINSVGEKEQEELDKTLAKMSKIYGFKLSSNDLTVTEYYSYLHTILDGKAN